MYQAELNKAKKENHDINKELTVLPRGRPLLFYFVLFFWQPEVEESHQPCYCSCKGFDNVKSSTEFRLHPSLLFIVG